MNLRKRALRGRDLVVFSNDWDGDPLSKTHIMRILARDNRILWVNSIGNRAPRIDGHDLRRIANKLQRFTEGVKEVEPNIFVFSPLAVPLYGSPAVRALNGVLLRAQLKRVMQQLHFERPISWSFLPSSAPVSGTLGEDYVVYHCVDEFSAFTDTNGAHIASLESDLLAKADLVVTSSGILEEEKKKQNAHTVLVRHGVDFKHFSKALDPKLEIPEALRALPKPIIGFFGLIAPWVDLEAIEKVARDHPTGSVVLLGKVAPDADVSRLEALPNVHFMGRRPYSELPAWCKGFDVALMPFVIDRLTLNSNPLKVREYLAAGLPVVSSDLPEVTQLGLCHIARDADDFPKKVRAALKAGGGPTRARAERIRHESWEARVDSIRDAVGEAMLRSGHRL
ncbi:MAG TPA: glycosyltransferase [Myxococcaceae bacterium]|nr:glycosyltransferase [Myxococcaceae bacterium]